MGFRNWFKPQAPADNTCELNNHVASIDGRLAEMGEHLQGLARLDEFLHRLHRIEAKQKEAGIQLDEISVLLQDGAEPLVGALMAAIDCVEDFYRFAAEDKASALFGQAEMMWNVVKGAAESAGISIIDDQGAGFDFKRATVQATRSVDGIPDGYVVETLKCGYIFRGEILRRAVVAVNKRTG